ncbi:MAG: hypothetical protein HOK97_19025 [Deltaproteobacteria bacterium]|nr:hypothetical protein [Deltaproteobacteria bacterium]MBT6491870.1 hypothetical protein [Deltaproteobacteria bacterium]
MGFDKRKVNARAAKANRVIEEASNRFVRSYHNAIENIGLEGRKAKYDDINYEFIGGAQDRMRKRHYDKSLRLLWKAENITPFLDFKDCTPQERLLQQHAVSAMNDSEKTQIERISLTEYKKFLDSQYTPKEKQAIVSILSAIGHGEAYAWLVSAELLSHVKSTGARAALTMQVLEEAKHFVVLRELLRAFDTPIPRLSIWEYILLEKVYKAEGLEKFFGMNVLIEGIALSVFGVMASFPGLEILRNFHLDESRHTALPGNYLREFPLTYWQKHSPIRKLKRLSMVLPSIALIPYLEEDFAELGIDAFDFGGSVVRKVTTLAERNGFYLPISNEQLMLSLDRLFNGYCSMTRSDHQECSFTQSETTRDPEALKVEDQVFGNVSLV